LVIADAVNATEGVRALAVVVALVVDQLYLPVVWAPTL
jgi:hypothetical protein